VTATETCGWDHLTRIDDPDGTLARLRDEARTLARAVEPHAIEADELDVLHADVVTALRDSGLARITVPAAHGGRHDRVSPTALCVVREEFMAVSSHLDTLFGVQGLGSFPIALAGSDELRARWLPRVADMTVLSALALTEQDAGSDLKGVTTRVSADGPQLRLDGRKTFITNAAHAGFFSTLVREGEGLSLFLVDASLPGITVGTPHHIVAPHVLADIEFDGVPIDPAARIGALGRGLEPVLGTLGVFRASVGAAAVGLATRALEETVRHTRDRRQFGRPLARHGAVAAMLADSWTEVEMARMLVYRAAELAEQGHPRLITYGSMAKLAATEMASKVVDRCVQMMGRFGLVSGSPVERLYRQARPMRLYEGATEVLQLDIAKTLVEEVR
jgi:acyl-CoA dehydrogenase